VLPAADTTSVPAAVTGLPETVNAGGIVKSTLVTVPTFHVLLADKLYETPLMVRVLVVGTGKNPIILNISKLVIGDADVTSPFPFTVNLRGVIDVYTSGFTVANVSVVIDPVKPDPETSPLNRSDPAGKTTGVVVTLVTNPLEFTVTTGTDDAPP
jgi:hypothetical protein